MGFTNFSGCQRTITIIKIIKLFGTIGIHSNNDIQSFMLILLQ